MAYTVTGTKSKVAAPIGGGGQQINLFEHPELRPNPAGALPNYAPPPPAPITPATSPEQAMKLQLDALKPASMPGLTTGAIGAPPAISPVPGQPTRLQSDDLQPAVMPDSKPKVVGFTTINPVTGTANMLPYTKGSGAGILGNVLGDPTRVGSLLGKPGASGALAISQPGAGAAGGAGGGVSGVPGAPAAGGPAGTPDVSPQGVLPNYLLDQFAGNLQGALKGELPADVQNLLAQQSAEYGVGSGTQGSQFQGYRGLRNLGLTSLDRMKQAEDILAGQITKPAEQESLDLKAKELADLQARADRAYGLDKQKLDDELKLERDKFAEQTNEFNKKYTLDELESLGKKYPGAGGGSGGGYGGLPNLGFGPTGIFNQARGVMEYY